MHDHTRTNVIIWILMTQKNQRKFLPYSLVLILKSSFAESLKAEQEQYNVSANAAVSTRILGNWQRREDPYVQKNDNQTDKLATGSPRRSRLQTNGQNC